MASFLAGQLAVAAATTLAKKTFEFSITSSLRGLSDIIKDRFATSRALLEAQAELEVKVKMLLLPVGILAQHATQGNTALQEPLAVALGVLEEVETFRQSLVRLDVLRAQDAAASPEANAAQLSKRLRDLVARLDSVLPYLNLAIATVALLNQGGACSPKTLSASRLMAASWRLRAHPQPGATVFSLPEAAWHEERQLTAAGPSMAEVFCLCSLSVCRSPSLPQGPEGGAEAGTASCSAAAAEEEAGGAWGYEVLVQQDLDDGRDHGHEEAHAVATLRLQVADIAALEWATTQSLQQGENEYRPALVLHVLGTAVPPVVPPAVGAAAKLPAARGEAAARGRPQPRTPQSTSGDRQAAAQPSSRAVAATASASPWAATPMAAVSRGGGAGGGVGGLSIRRCAVMCAARLEEAGDGEDSDQEDSPSSETPGSSASDSDTGSEPAHQAASEAAAAGPAAAVAASSAALLREWRLLGELEYVLRLAMMECRERTLHHELTDERIAMAFQASSVPATTGFSAAGPAPEGNTTALASSARQRSGTAASAKWRGAAVGSSPACAVDDVTIGVQRLSFTPKGGAGLQAEAGPQPAVPAPAAKEGGSETVGSAGGLASGRRRSARKSGFGSPVQ